MSILIKGMEMPKYGCDNCFLRTGNYCGRIEKDEAVVEYARKNERHPDCPLVPVPSHGRLIDGDLLPWILANKDVDYASYEDWEKLCDAIRDAPTIIEAEEGE